MKRILITKYVLCALFMVLLTSNGSFAAKTTESGQEALSKSSLTIRAFPDRVFAPYVDVLLWPTPDLSAIADETQVMHYTLAFITSMNGEPAWGGVTPLGDGFYKDQIDALRAKGGDVAISFGGANGTELALDITDVIELQQKYQDVIDMYNLTWVDFDIEGWAVAERESIDRRSKAIRGLQIANPGLFVAFCLPVLPTGLTHDGLYVLQNAIENGVRIDLVNIMAMNYGTAVVDDPYDQGPEAIKAAESTFAQLQTLYPDKSDAEIWNMIGITPMIGKNDTVPLVFYLQAAQEVLAFAQEKNLKMLSMWSIGRDKACPGGGSYVSPTCSGITQADRAFSNIFNAFSNGGGPPPKLNPTAGFSYAAQGLTVTFTDQSSDADGEIAGYRWDFGDGQISSEQNPVHAYSAAGTYTVRLTVQDDQGLTGSKTEKIVVGGTQENQPPVADFTYAFQGLTVTFTDTSSDPDGQIVERRWNYGSKTDPNLQCDGATEWDADQDWTEYSVGDLRTNAGKLWSCINVAYSYHEPSGPYGHFGWQDMGACTGVSAMSSGLCDGVAPWDASQNWTEYGVGDLRTNAGRLWSCIKVAYSYHEPSGPYGHFGWQDMGACSGGGSQLVTQHTYPSAGTYTVRLTVQDDQGATASKSVTIQVGGQ